MIYFDRNNFPADGNISELCETVHSNLKSCLTVIYKVPCDPVSQLSPLSRDSFISFSLLKQIRALETCWWILLSCCGCAEADISVLRPELQCFISDYQLTRDAALSAARLWHPSCSIVVKTVRFPSLISIISSQQQHLVCFFLTSWFSSFLHLSLSVHTHRQCSYWVLCCRSAEVLLGAFICRLTAGQTRSPLAGNYCLRNQCCWWSDEEQVWNPSKVL